jgi:predicted lipoprotein with Yx(FWY)xxD motif
MARLTFTRMRLSPRYFAAAAATAVLLAGCGGNSATTSSPAPPKTAGGDTATIGLANNGNLGKILVDSKGDTVYLFQKDTGTKSTCFGKCAVNWPPLDASSKPTEGSGADPAMVGTTSRPGGKSQVTYNGHPLYLFAGDKNAGDTNGEGVNAFGGNWYALTPAGDQVTPPANGGGGGGYGY